MTSENYVDSDDEKNPLRQEEIARQKSRHVGFGEIGDGEENNANDQNDGKPKSSFERSTSNRASFKKMNSKSSAALNFDA